MVDTVDTATARGLKFSDGAPDFHFTSRLVIILFKTQRLLLTGYFFRLESDSLWMKDHSIGEKEEEGGVKTTTEGMEEDTHMMTTGEDLQTGE